MSRLDVAKETIAYLKFWMGVLVVSDISLVGWLLSDANTTPDLKTYAAVFAVVVITLSTFIVHKDVKRIILTLEEL